MTAKIIFHTFKPRFNFVDIDIMSVIGDLIGSQSYMGIMLTIPAILFSEFMKCGQTASTTSF
ncbi:MAG: hypothetical protein JRE23_14955 [Deltaproteobacteria bacterium]|nr:hypothetical protein [Deltaproteobacteria bacterium]